MCTCTQREHVIHVAICIRTSIRAGSVHYTRPPHSLAPSVDTPLIPPDSQSQKIFHSHLQQHKQFPTLHYRISPVVPKIDSLHVQPTLSLHSVPLATQLQFTNMCCVCHVVIQLSIQELSGVEKIPTTAYSTKRVAHRSSCF